MSAADNRLKIIVVGGLVVVVSLASAAALLYRANLFQPRIDQALRGLGADSSSRPVSSNTRVSGTVVTPDGTPQIARLTLVRGSATRPPVPLRGRGANAGRGSFTTTSTADGRFEFRFVPAGPYWLVAHAETLGRAPAFPAHFWAVQELTADGSGSIDARMALEPAATISGRVSLNARAGTSSPDFTAITVTLTPADARTQAVATLGPLTATPDESGTFFFSSVPAGQYTPDVGIDRSWSLEAATMDGRVWVDQPLEIKAAAAPARAHLILTDRPNEIAGTVRRKTGDPAPFSLVMVFSPEESLRKSPRRARAIRSGPDGRFSLTGFPAGDYLVAVADDVPAASWFTPDGFTQLAARAARVSLQPGDAINLALVR